MKQEMDQNSDTTQRTIRCVIVMNVRDHDVLKL